MWEKTVSRAARAGGRRCWGPSWTLAGAIAITASACAYGADPLEPVTGNDGSSSVAGSSGVRGSVGNGGSAGDGMNGSSGGSGGNAGAMVDMSGGNGGTAVDDGSTVLPPDASSVDSSDGGGVVVVKDAAPDAPCPTGGKALSFDGTSRVDIPGTSLPIANSPRTVEMWISPAAITSPAWSPNHTVFEHGGGSLQAFALDMDVFPMMELYVNPAANSFFFNTGIAQATWFHVAATYDGAMTTRAFVNGADKGSKTLTGPLATIVTTLGVGGTSSARNFIGSIDEVRVWNVARTATEIQQSMSVRLTGNEAGLVGYWRFDEGTGTTVRDSSTKGTAGTLVGPVSWIASGVTLTCR
jgi:hypothetical protein